MSVIGAAGREHALKVLGDHASEIRGRGVAHLALFGSTARGEARPDSDVDLLIEIDPAAVFGLFALLDLKEYLEGLLGRPVNFAFGSRLRPRIRERVEADAVRVF